MPDAISPPDAAMLWVDIDSSQEVVVSGLGHILRTKFGESLFVTAGPVDGEPDVVLYDVYGLRNGDTTELDRLRQMTGSVVIAVSYDGLRPDLEALALQRGAAAVIPLSISAEQLADVVRAATEGHLEAVPTVRLPDVSVYPGKSNGLTRRESDVLALIVHGWTNQEIADQCFLSVNSVKTYIRSAYRKIGAQHRAQAVVWAMQRGFSPSMDRA